MRKWLALTAGLCLSLAIAVPSVQAAPTSPFTGTWTGQDPPPPVSDGSTMHLYVLGGTRALIVLTDDYASVCKRAGLPVTYWSVLTGTVSGNTLNATTRVAMCGRAVLRSQQGALHSWLYDDLGTSDLADDTLWDDWTLWYRD